MKSFDEFSRKESVILIFGVIILFSGVITWWIVDTISAEKENVSLEVIGKIQNVNYYVKGSPVFIIHGKGFHFGPGYNVNYQIQVGDSLIKKKGSTTYKLIKHGSGIILEFKK